ncbi:macro domain-containing protein [Pilimelia terevasa]|uniref:Macro domain-containing protein n=1 Tax=Pilimelia terevasa TaxID=53372 RepID=A0A8J3BTR9_9ACTN|nr:O-acetyl-ADP-ribose deacetylase [Pilimelia terevasa]GGK34264.1 macro domain-containing protein [Pilimelia terevasa]
MALTMELTEGDLTTQPLDAVVNAANAGLLGGGGVDGALHARGGPAILAACRELRATRYPDGLPVGAAVATTAGRLPARWVIHTVGPVYAPGVDQGALLRSCYTESLRVAGELGARTVGFPLISAGAYGWPVPDAVAQALAALRAAPAGPVTLARLVLFGAPTYAVAAAVAAAPPGASAEIPAV